MKENYMMEAEILSPFRNPIKILDKMMKCQFTFPTKWQ